MLGAKDAREQTLSQKVEEECAEHVCVQGWGVGMQ